MSDYPSNGEMPASGSEIIPAATAVIFRRSEHGHPQLLMVQRARALSFGGAVVFPGGKVDDADRVLAQRLYPNEEQELASARIAAIRETLEETGLVIAVREPVSSTEAAAARAMLITDGRLEPVLEAFSWTLAPERLTLFAHWCPKLARAFDTRFFVTDLGTGAVDITVDATENTKLFWASAAQVLKMADAGEIRLVFPTRRNLERLAQFGSFEDVLAHIACHQVSRIHPIEVDRDGEVWLQLPDGHGYPILGEPMSTSLRS
jgi:8-oxo-dGTP pyrophosphatase MutT (NUDIX family)